MSIPVSVITDLDVKPDKENVVGSQTKKTMATMIKERKEKKFNGQKVKTFVSPHWTLEYCLVRSEVLGQMFFESVKEKHPNITGTVAKDEVSIKLEQGTLKKAEIAQIFADKLHNSSVSKSDLESDNDIKYLLDAIKYATGN
jgi:putative ATP-dependent endonuclease of OLD family